jgi:cytochrome c peroxidase
MRALAVIGMLVLAGAAMAQEAPSAQVRLGRLLFWDKVLSGNHDIACGTCHNPDFGTSDGVALGLGTGAAGVGPARQGAGARMRRNVPALFNLSGAAALFHDGRVEALADGFRTPMGAALPRGLDNLLAAQAGVPVLSPEEMAGRPGENAVADAVAAGDPAGALDLVAARVAALPGYEAPVRAAIGDRAPGFADIANAIAAFVAFEWRSQDSPYDRALAGDPLTGAAERGRALFLGAAGCGDCHSGPLQSDGRFHATAAPGADHGRFEVTGAAADEFAFRTPSLRNVALTGPYGHDGATASLPAYLALHPADAAWPDPAGREDLYRFLLALTGDGAMAGRLGVPATVPSGLPVDR